MEPLILHWGGAEARLWPRTAPLHAAATAAVGALRGSPDHWVPLLRAAAAAAGDLGARFLVGPLAGDTWHRYRCVVAGDATPAFFLEPFDDGAMAAAFGAAGLVPLADYVSSIARPPFAGVGPGDDPSLVRRGIAIAPFDPRDALATLAEVYRLTLWAFRRNLLFRPLGWPAFLGLYGPLLGRLPPEGLWLARDARGALLGYALAMPEPLGLAQERRLIFKTYATVRGGVGIHLFNRVHRWAATAGFDAVVHALMHVDNVSRRHSRRCGHPFRRYRLFVRELAP
ncbi:MAG: hypothetical protein ACFCBW_18740 [Candidatus Competibacterales bacterium]